MYGTIPTYEISKLHFTSIVVEDHSEILWCGPGPLAAVVQQHGSLVIMITHGIVHKPIRFIENSIKAEGRNGPINVVTYVIPMSSWLRVTPKQKFVSQIQSDSQSVCNQFQRWMNGLYVSKPNILQAASDSCGSKLSAYLWKVTKYNNSSNSRTLQCTYIFPSGAQEYFGLSIQHNTTLQSPKVVYCCSYSYS